MKEIGKEQKKSPLNKFSTILGILALILTGLVAIFQFLHYLYEMQWFNYWGIDKIFYYQNSTDIMNNLIYYFVISLIIIFLFSQMYKNLYYESTTIKDWIKFLFLFLIFYTGFYLTNIPNFDLIGKIAVYIIGVIICLIIMWHYTKKLFRFINIIKKSEYTFIIFKDVIENLLIMVISIFVVIVLLGFINVYGTNEYKIIKNNNETCDVILYSTADYYIIASCEIENNDLTIYKNTQRKIDNYNVIYQTKKFNSIKNDNE